MATKRFDFEDLEVYERARELADAVAEFVPYLDGHHRSLGWQMFDAACSVPLNVAESTGRRTPRDRARFLDIANGSARETASATLIADGWDVGPQELRARILDHARDIVSMLTVQARRQRSRAHPR
ncbi:MAG: four helix bundle protein [Candidatus Longimicrobiales bacterium M2_2A_002]